MRDLLDPEAHLGGLVAEQLRPLLERVRRAPARQEHAVVEGGHGEQKLEPDGRRRDRKGDALVVTSTDLGRRIG